MPLLCIHCDTRVERSTVDPKVFWCPSCEKEIKGDDTYKVGKRFFATGIGATLLALAALHTKGSTTIPPSREEAASTYKAMQRSKRKKLKGLKMKQRRHTRQKGGK